ncbi:group II intron maturase-specific domain-containing protein [Streptomyces sp. NPDC059455]|uniref:group II intron maturase-specific domain-containing protein n=1 Tax=Streptomyces sp. NPDC059455 TaxID=3346837 RepID=UPI0036B8FA1B
MTPTPSSPPDSASESRPSSCARLRARLRTEVKGLHGSNAEAVLRRLIPIVRGWAAYYRAVASTTTFSSLGPGAPAPRDGGLLCT